MYFFFFLIFFSDFLSSMFFRCGAYDVPSFSSASFRIITLRNARNSSSCCLKVRLLNMSGVSFINLLKFWGRLARWIRLELVRPCAPSNLLPSLRCNVSAAFSLPPSLCASSLLRGCLCEPGLRLSHSLRDIHGLLIFVYSFFFTIFLAS